MTVAMRHHHPLGRHVRTERGSVSVQMVVLMPLMFTIAFVGLQAGLYYYGRSAALAVANTGARAAAAEGAPSRSCEAATAAMLADLGDVLTEPTVTCALTTATVTVRVTGRTLSVIPGWDPRVEQSAHLNRERISHDRQG